MKSQSSLEFLMTYGWAILIIFIVTAVFVNFGLGDPANYSSERCLFESDFTCEEFAVYKLEDQVKMEVVLSNSLPYKVNITDFKIVSLSGITGGLTYEYASQNPIGVGNNFKLITTFDSPQYGIDLLQARVSVVYEIQRAGFFPRTVHGSIVGKIN